MPEQACSTCGEMFDTRGLSTHERNCDPSEREKLRRLYWDENMSIPQIADELDTAYRVVYGKMDRYGIETRSPGEGKRLRHQHDVQMYWAHGRLWIKIGEYGEDFAFPVARATAMADHSLEELDGMDVHHKNDHPADDRPSNLELLDHAEHSALTNS